MLSCAAVALGCVYWLLCSPLKVCGPTHGERVVCTANHYFQEAYYVFSPLMPEHVYNPFYKKMFWYNSIIYRKKVNYKDIKKWMFLTPQQKLKPFSISAADNLLFFKLLTEKKSIIMSFKVNVLNPSPKI